MMVAKAEGLEGSSCSTTWPCTRAAAANRRARMAMTGGLGFYCPLNLAAEQTVISWQMAETCAGFRFQVQSDIVGSTLPLC